MHGSAPRGTTSEMEDESTVRWAMPPGGAGRAENSDSIYHRVLFLEKARLFDIKRRIVGMTRPASRVPLSWAASGRLSTLAFQNERDHLQSLRTRATLVTRALQTILICI